MARSLKKGPFADESLLKKVKAMNEAGSKQVIPRRKKTCASVCNRGHGWA